MDEFGVQFLAEKAPELAGLIIVVVIFLRAMRRRDELMVKEAQRITGAFFEHLRDIQEVLNRNSELMGEVKTLLRWVGKVVERGGR